MAAIRRSHGAFVSQRGRRPRSLDGLCRTYHPLLLAHLGALRYRKPDAEDLVQGFFVYLIRSHALAAARPEQGPFRNFLLIVFRRYVADQAEHAARLKRGGGANTISLDQQLPVFARALFDSAGNSDVSQCDYDWAARLEKLASGRLRAEYESSPERRRTHRYLRPFLASPKVPHLQLQRKLFRRAGTLRCDLSRIRARYVALLKEEVAAAARPGEAEADFEYVRQVLFFS